ncbi:hypothetical protein NY78_1515 [Desulfovibrio sp. TomC]|nr:hypothetical protein NY78_1515 [Desulfovibrio sp. TomC]
MVQTPWAFFLYRIASRLGGWVTKRTEREIGAEIRAFSGPWLFHEFEHIG